jgi:plasmid replication initiation protein
MKKDLVVKDNALINASYNLDLVEQRLILLAILEARESNTPTHKDLTIHVDSYINHFNVHRNTAYKALKDASRNCLSEDLATRSSPLKVISRM